ncbi:MAG: hypothetical protein WD960_11865 [Gemmatimonadota bacterium]
MPRLASHSHRSPRFLFRAFGGGVTPFRFAGSLRACVLLALPACAPDPDAPSEPPPTADVQVEAIIEGAYVSPVTNTPYGGSHVRQYPGQPSGTVTTHGEVIVLELDEGVVSEENLFDLDGRTLRFTPEGEGFRVENLALEWVEERGEVLRGQALELATPFPFSGSTWTSAVVDNMGLITFGGGYDDFGLGRFVHYELAGPSMVGKVPAIVPFLKHRMRGERYVHETPDRVVITWDQTEPAGGQQDFTFEPTPHLYQAVLHSDGRIDLSYQEMTARDAIVGVFAVPSENLPPTQAVDLSAMDPSAEPAPAVFEGFHRYGLPRAENLACTVIDAFGDRFDFMVWYSDFRMDDQEAGTRSDGDISQEVEGIGDRMDIGRRPEDYCSDGRLQVTWHQPVWVGAVQAQESSPDRSWNRYDRAMAQIAHEHGHRWSTRTQAIVNGDTVDLRGTHVPWAMSGAGHWPGGLHTPSPFPYGDGEHEGSVMGGAVYQDNEDGTFTVLDRGTMHPASGFSYLELYLIGVLPPEEVPPFFLLQDTETVGRDEAGRQVIEADKIDITLADVIAHNGPRVPSVEEAPKDFTSAFVAVVLPGQSPSPELLEGTEGIRRQWIEYWERITGGRSTMSTDPEG